MLVGCFAYFLLAKFGMAVFSLQPSNITLLWLPSGIGLLMCLAAGTRALPFIFLASFSANFHGMALPSLGLQLLHTLVAAFADTLAAWLAAFMLRRHLPSGLSKPFDLIPFTLYVCMIPTLVSAALLAANLVLGGYIEHTKTVDFVFMLLVADSLGILLCYPLLETWNARQQKTPVEILSWFLLTTGTLAIVHLAFTWMPALIFLLMPVFLYMIFRERHAGVHLALAAVVCLIVAEAAHNLGPFQIIGPDHGRLMLVFFLFSTAITITGMRLQQHQLFAEQMKIADQNVQLSKAKEAAEAADIAKSHFLANMSHEMRTPLHQMLGLAELLRRDPLTEKQASRLGMLEKSGKHMTDLVESVLEITRLESGMTVLKEASFAIGELLNEVAEMIQLQASSKNIQLTVDLDSCPDNMVGDVRLIRLALFNYAKNAARFTEQGSVTLRARLLQEKQLPSFIRFEVQDTGVGIAPEDAVRLFSIFEQVDNSSTRKFGGLGVGLAMTQKISTIMGGKAGFDSKIGEGSTFWFTVQTNKI